MTFITRWSTPTLTTAFSNILLALSRALYVSIGWISQCHNSRSESLLLHRCNYGDSWNWRNKQKEQLSYGPKTSLFPQLWFEFLLSTDASTIATTRPCSAVFWYTWGPLHLGAFGQCIRSDSRPVDANSSWWKSAGGRTDRHPLTALFRCLDYVSSHVLGWTTGWTAESDRQLAEQKSSGRLKILTLVNSSKKCQPLYQRDALNSLSLLWPSLFVRRANNLYKSPSAIENNSEIRSEIENHPDGKRRAFDFGEIT